MNDIFVQQLFSILKARLICTTKHNKSAPKIQRNSETKSFYAKTELLSEKQAGEPHNIIQKSFYISLLETSLEGGDQSIRSKTFHTHTRTQRKIRKKDLQRSKV